MDLSEREDRIARVLAEHVTAIESRREGEPVDVCRFHRELAAAVVAALPPERGAVSLDEADVVTRQYHMQVIEALVAERDLARAFADALKAELDHVLDQRRGAVNGPGNSPETPAALDEEDA